MKKLVIFLALVVLLIAALAPTALAETQEAAVIDAGLTVLIIFAAVAVVLIGMLVIMPGAIRRNVDMTGVLSGAADFLSTAQKIITGLKGVMPEAKGLSVAYNIIQYTKEGVDAAEKMYLAHSLERNDRKAKAEEITYDLLAVADIEITDSIRKVIEGCIEAAVQRLPKTHPVNADEGGVS